MEEQRDRARAAIADRGAEAAGAFAREAGFDTEFVGYERLDVTTQVGALGDGGDSTLLLKLRESPFYARGGGQVADAGYIESDGGPRGDRRRDPRGRRPGAGGRAGARRAGAKRPRARPRR